MPDLNTQRPSIQPLLGQRLTLVMFWLLSRLPARWAFAVGERLGKLLYQFAGSRRAIAARNIELCLPELTPTQRDALLREHFRYTGRAVAETALAWCGGSAVDQIPLRIHGLDHLKAAQADNTPVILLSAHFLCVELAARLIGQHIDMAVIYKPMRKKPLLDQAMRRSRQRTLLGVYPRNDLRGILKSLKQGIPTWYAGDQDYGVDHSVFVPFMGVPAATITGLTGLARLSQARVVPVFFHVNEQGNGYEVEFKPALNGFPSRSEALDAQWMNAVIEPAIRARPAQYLWSHRRFKHPPPGERSAYPNTLQKAHNRVRGATVVIGPAWVGDLVMAQSLFKTLKAQAPHAPIDVVTPAWGRNLIARMPEVRRAIVLDIAHGELKLGKRLQLARTLRANQYEHAIVLPRSAKAALPVGLAGIRQRTGYLGEHRYGLLNDIRPLDRTVLYRTVDRFVALAHTTPPASAPDCPQPQLTSTAAEQRASLKALGLSVASERILTLCPGADYGPAKRWPPEYFAALAQRFITEGWQVWLLGSAGDRAITQTIQASAPKAIDLTGQTSLAQAVDLLALSTVVVSNDSGLMHIAAATGQPVVALYGSSDPQYTPPLSDQAQVIYHNLDCSPCFARHCPLGHLNCLRGITPDEVAKAIKEI